MVLEEGRWKQVESHAAYRHHRTWGATARLEHSDANMRDRRHMIGPDSHMHITCTYTRSTVLNFYSMAQSVPAVAGMERALMVWRMWKEDETGEENWPYYGQCIISTCS
jgi:hypothetical protein